jgi:putative SOS response-associated peptidase YedK
MDPALLAVRIDAVDETGGPAGTPNYNVAPTTTIAAVVARHDERHRDEPNSDRNPRRC